MVGDGDGRLHELADEDRPQVRPLGAPVRQREHHVELPPSTVDVSGAGQEAGRHRVRVGGNTHPPLDGHACGIAQVRRDRPARGPPRAAGTCARCRRRCRRPPRPAARPRSTAGLRHRCRRGAGRVRRDASRAGIRGAAGAAVRSRTRTRSWSPWKAGEPSSSSAVEVSSRPCACRSWSPARSASNAISRAMPTRSAAVPGVQMLSCWASRQLASVIGSSMARASSTARSASGRARGRSRATECASCRARAAVTCASISVPVPAAASRARSSTATRSPRRHGEPGTDPVQPKRDCAHPLRIAACGGPLPGCVEQGVCRPAAPARSRASASAVNRSTRSASDRGSPASADSLAGSGEMARCVRVREPCLVGGGSPPGPGERRLRAGDRRGRGEMPGQLGREHRGAPLVSADERLAHPSVQVDSLGPGEGGIDRLAVQVVAEPHALGGRAGGAGVGRVGPEGSASAAGLSTPPATASSTSSATRAGSCPMASASTSGCADAPATATPRAAGRSRTIAAPAGGPLSRGSPPGRPRRRRPRPARRSAPARRTGVPGCGRQRPRPTVRRSACRQARPQARSPRPGSTQPAAPARRSRSVPPARRPRRLVARPAGTLRRRPAAGGTPSPRGTASGPQWTGRSTAGRRAGRRWAAGTPPWRGAARRRRTPAAGPSRRRRHACWPLRQAPARAPRPQVPR